MADLIIRGLPLSLANDAWWFTDTDVPQDQVGASVNSTHGKSIFAPLGLIAIIFLIALADVMFWHQPIGISLVLFSLGLSTVALLNLQPHFSRYEWVIIAGLWCLAALPVIEFVQTVSVVFLLVGHAALLVWCTTRSNIGLLARAILYLPVTLLSFATVCSVNLGITLFRGKTSVNQSGILACVLPLILGAVFLWLFIGANPVFQQWINDLLDLNITADGFSRIAFWIVIGFLVLPFALFKRLVPHLTRKVRTRSVTVKPQGVLINSLSIRLSLILFNVMFALQNVTDLTILWSGAGLPEGMTYATYAHSGAYPLMATSILAGLFALVSRRFTFGSNLIKMLLLVWIAQNILLLTSAVLRLDLYIDVYGLTYLRLRAGIGMFLVIVGMALMIWQLWKSKTNAWLTGSFAAVTICVFYLCSFVNFGYVIAAENLSRNDRAPDTYYLCSQTHTSVKAFLEHQTATRETPCIAHFRTVKFQADNWRGWSFRIARMEGYRQTYLDTLKRITDETLSKSKTQVRDRQTPTP